MQENGGSEPVRIGLVVSDSLRLEGLRELLEERRGYQLVPLDVTRVQDLASLAVVILDAADTGHLLELIATLRRARPRVCLVVLAENGDPDFIERVIGAGAKGFLTYGAREEELTMALQVVLDNSVWAPRKVLARLLATAEGKAPEPPARVEFTARETQVLHQLVLGRSNREIATRLKVDEAAIKAHVGRLLRKAGVGNRTALTMRALAAGWVSRDA